MLSNSVALLADAAHNLSDVLGLVAAWLPTVLAKRPPSPRYSYGLKGSSTLAALFNAVFLLVVMGGLSWEAIRRLFGPERVAGKTVMIVAAIGLVLNGLTAWLFVAGRKDDINIRGAFLKMRRFRLALSSEAWRSLSLDGFGSTPSSPSCQRCRRVEHIGFAP